MQVKNFHVSWNTWIFSKPQGLINDSPHFLKELGLDSYRYTEPQLLVEKQQKIRKSLYSSRDSKTSQKSGKISGHMWQKASAYKMSYVRGWNGMWK